MNNNVDKIDSLEKTNLLGKKLECWIGLFFLIPPVLGVLFFVISVFGGGSLPQLDELSENWTARYGYSNGGGGGMSAAPIYLGLMALVGAYLVKNSLKYLFIKSDTATKKDNSIS